VAITRKRVSLPDISFPNDPKLAALSQYVKWLEREIIRMQQILDGGTAGQVLTKTSARTYDAGWADP